MGPRYLPTALFLVLKGDHFSVLDRAFDACDTSTLQEIGDQPHQVAIEYAAAQEQLGCRTAPVQQGQNRRSSSIYRGVLWAVCSPTRVDEPRGPRVRR
jgi:hypothetical protein